MNRTMITASNTMAQLQKQLDIISNNVANIQTHGYKRREATFSDLMAQHVQNMGRPNAEVGRLTPNGIRLGVGAKLGQAKMVLTQGNVVSTDRMLDFAINSENQFFKVLTENGVQFTRNGAFYLSPVGDNQTLLVNSDGLPILDENNNQIVFNGPLKEISLSDEGQLVFTPDEGPQQTFAIGMIAVQKPQFLEQKGNNLLGLPENFNQLNVLEADVYTELVGALRTEINIQQGSLEQSNVDLSKEMTDLLNTQRSYQFQARSITLADQMLGLINGIR